MLLKAIDPTQFDPSYLFGVIGEKHRLRILAILLIGSAHVEDIRKQMTIEETLLSKHLKALRDAGLVLTKREGRHKLYSLNPKIMKAKSKDSLSLGCCEIKLKI